MYNSQSPHCNVCLDTPVAAVETDCCGEIFCEECLPSAGPCPGCNSPDAPQHANCYVRRLVQTGTTLQIPLINQNGFDPAIPLVNDEGRTARLGQSGKYYCEGVWHCPHRTMGVAAASEAACRCACCSRTMSGLCGPSDGCNCIPCQRLDLSTRGLAVPWMVAPDGTLARRYSNERPKGARFGCGRRFTRVLEARTFLEKIGAAMKTNDELVFYCGSSEKIVCPSCQCLDDHF